MTTLVHTKYWIVELEPEHGLVRVRRTAEPITSLEVFERQRAEIGAAITGVDQARYGLLLDLRDGPLRSDPEFERRLREVRGALFLGFTRVAILVRTAVGRLQVTRQAREAGEERMVFMDEAEALAWFTHGAAHAHHAQGAHHAARPGAGRPR